MSLGPDGRHGESTYRETESLHTFTGDAQRHDQIAENPEQHQIGPERLVRVVHTLVLLLRRDHVRRQRSLDRGFELAVNVGLRLVHLFDEVRLGVVLLGLRLWERFTLVGALGTPGHVVPVAEGIHHQDVDRAGHAAKIRPGGGEHVPGVHVEEASHKVHSVGRHQRDQHDARASGAEEGRQES